MMNFLKLSTVIKRAQRYISASQSRTLYGWNLFVTNAS